MTCLATMLPVDKNDGGLCIRRSEALMTSKIIQINLLNQIKTLCMLTNSIQISNTYNHIFTYHSLETNTISDKNRPNSCIWTTFQVI